MKAARRNLGCTRHLAEMFITPRGEAYLLLRAVTGRAPNPAFRWHDETASKCFRRVLRSGPAPCKIVTDQSRNYPAARVVMPELANGKHVFVKAATQLNNQTENKSSDDTRAPFRCRLLVCLRENAPLIFPSALTGSSAQSLVTRPRQ